MKAQDLLLAFASVVILAPPSAGQAPVELKLTETVKVPNQTSDGFLEPLKCDSNSNIFFRIMQDPLENSQEYPVVRVSADCKSTLVFGPPKLEDKRLGIVDFDPTPDGGLVLLTSDYEGANYIEIYDDHAQFHSRWLLPPEFVDAMQLAASPSGKVFVSGLISSAALGGDDATRPFAGIFDQRGKLEREVLLTDDIQASESGDPTEAGKVRSAVGFSSARSLDNGNFILARLQSRGTIYVVSPIGFELHRFSPPLPAEDSFLSGVQIGGNTIAAMYLKKKTGSDQNELSDAFVSLLDSGTGDVQGRFHHSSWEIGAAFACYDKGVFTFLTTSPKSEVQIVQAEGASK
jgi:hypothetical protein